MDFVKKILHQISRKSEAVSQITFDEDYNVPDARPDVGRMIQKKGEVTIGDVQISEGKARVFGGLTFHLLYVSDGERRRICQLSGELPIDETIHLDGLTGGDKVCITWEVEDLNLHLINSRKLGVRAIVTLHAWIEELCDLAVPMEIRGESDVAVKRQEYRVVELAAPWRFPGRACAQPGSAIRHLPLRPASVPAGSRPEGRARRNTVPDKPGTRRRPASRNCTRFSGRIWKCAVSISALRRGGSVRRENSLSSVCTATARRITRCSGWSRRSRSRQKWNARAASPR